MGSDQSPTGVQPDPAQPTEGRVEGGKSPAPATVRETTAQQLHPGAGREGGQEGGHRGQRPS